MNLERKQVVSKNGFVTLIIILKLLLSLGAILTGIMMLLKKREFLPVFQMNGLRMFLLKIG